MKTVKTANGFKKIEDSNMDLVSIQLRTILQEHRATLINKLLQGTLDAYIDRTFNMKAAPVLSERINNALHLLKHSGIDVAVYTSIFDAVSKNDFTSLDNTLFYSEIDQVIKSTLFQPQFFPETQRHFFQ
jgi:hypothetical protein